MMLFHSIKKTKVSHMLINRSMSILFSFLILFFSLGRAEASLIDNFSANIDQEVACSSTIKAGTHPSNKQEGEIPEPIAELEEKEKEDEKNHLIANLIPEDVTLHAHSHFCYQHFSDSFRRILPFSIHLKFSLLQSRFLLFENFLI